MKCEICDTKDKSKKFYTCSQCDRTVCEDCIDWRNTWVVLGLDDDIQYVCLDCGPDSIPF